MYKKIMVPLDGSQLAECVLPHLREIVRGIKPVPEIWLVQAVEPIAIPYGREVAEINSIEQLKAFEIHNRVEAKKYMDGIAAQLANAGISAKVEVIFGKAAEALGEFAKKSNIDMVIISTHGRSGISRWVWGSVADRLLRSVSAPVLMVRAPGCVPVSQIGE